MVRNQSFSNGAVLSVGYECDACTEQKADVNVRGTGTKENFPKLQGGVQIYPF